MYSPDVLALFIVAFLVKMTFWEVVKLSHRVIVQNKCPIIENKSSQRPNEGIFTQMNQIQVIFHTPHTSQSQM